METQIKSNARRLGVSLYAINASTPALLAQELCPLLGLQPSSGRVAGRGRRRDGDDYGYGRRYSPDSLWKPSDESNESTYSDEDGYLEEGEEVGL